MIESQTGSDAKFIQTVSAEVLEEAGGDNVVSDHAGHFDMRPTGTTL